MVSVREYSSESASHEIEKKPESIEPIIMFVKSRSVRHWQRYRELLHLFTDGFGFAFSQLNQTGIPSAIS
jgi:hypothetical protein